MKEIKLQLVRLIARLVSPRRQPADPPGLPAAESNQVRHYIRTVPPPADHSDEYEMFGLMVYGGLG